MAKAHSAHSRLRPPRPLRIKLLHNLLKTQTIRPQEARGTAVQDGLTLIECLVAMIIITIVVAIITPPIFLAVGTRVNNRRTEQALQVAQGEIERVRLLMISNLSFQDIKDSLPPESPGASPTALQGVAAATTVCADGPPPATCSSPTALYKIPGGDLYVQTFRDAGASVPRTVAGTTQDEIIAFNMGVRVYSQEALNASRTAPKGTLQVKEGSLNFTSGTKSRGAKPLVTLYTEMTRGTERDALTTMNEYIKNKY